jgi:hypothetical protein
MSKKITHCDVRMYRMGTGDCFVLKFFTDKINTFKMMIDCGVWTGSKEFLSEFVTDMLDYVDYHVDILVVTHEHKDHVSVFDTCKDLFESPKKFKVDKVWMGWTENEGLKAVKKWKKEYGQKNKALALAAKKINSIVKDKKQIQKILLESEGERKLKSQESLSHGLNNFVELHSTVNSLGEYVGGLKGMDFVKNNLGKGKIEYFNPGNILSEIEGLIGIKFFIFGPPKSYDSINAESGGAGESYDHNKVLKENNSFANALLSGTNDESSNNSPFDSKYFEENESGLDYYNTKKLEWRKIDNEWLNSAGELALRMNSLTNNLSLAFAIEFEDSRKVMLFPGDAEYGSWASWHQINWAEKGVNKDIHLTEDLLNRTVFYKVAHHLSHNGTAQRLGLEMMTSKELAAMATLDYDVISSTWKNTMPNKAILKELVQRTKGKLMILNEDNLYYDSKEKVLLGKRIIEEQKKMNKKESSYFKKYFISEPLYLQYTVFANQQF